eukprot:9471245-Pyramimonas_sp.AAC.1
MHELLFEFILLGEGNQGLVLRRRRNRKPLSGSIPESLPETTLGTQVPQRVHAIPIALVLVRDGLRDRCNVAHAHPRVRWKHLPFVGQMVAPGLLHVAEQLLENALVLPKPLRDVSPRKPIIPECLSHDADVILELRPHGSQRSPAMRDHSHHDFSIFTETRGQGLERVGPTENALDGIPALPRGRTECSLT